MPHSALRNLQPKDAPQNRPAKRGSRLRAGQRSGRPPGRGLQPHLLSGARSSSPPRQRWQRDTECSHRQQQCLPRMQQQQQRIPQRPHLKSAFQVQLRRQWRQASMLLLWLPPRSASVRGPSGWLRRVSGSSSPTYKRWAEGGVVTDPEAVTWQGAIAALPPPCNCF